MQRESKVTQMSADNHRTFSRVTGRDAKGEIVWRSGWTLATTGNYGSS